MTEAIQTNNVNWLLWFPICSRGETKMRLRWEQESIVKSVKPETLLPLQWPLAPHDHPTRCCRSPAGFLTLSLSFHASLKRENSILPWRFLKTILKWSHRWQANRWVQFRRTNSEGLVYHWVGWGWERKSYSSWFTNFQESEAGKWQKPEHGCSFCPLTSCMNILCICPYCNTHLWLH